MNPQEAPKWPDKQTSWDKTQETIKLNQEATKLAKEVGTDKAIVELEELRCATLAALKDLHKETCSELDGLQWEIDYSKWVISEKEFIGIQEEFNDVELINKEHYITELVKAVDEKWVTRAYMPLIFTLQMYPEVETSTIQQITSEIQTHWRLSFATLKNLQELFQWAIETDKIIEQQIEEDIFNGLESWWIRWDMISSYDVVQVLKVLEKVLDKNPEHFHDFVFDTDLQSIFWQCSWDIIVFVDYMREKYRNSKEVVISENISNFLLTQKGIEASDIDWLTQEIDKLSHKMQAWGCSIDYLKDIQEFINTHFEDSGITLDKDSAIKIIWSVIEAKKTDIEVRKLEAEKLEDDIKQKWILAELSDDKRDIERQEKTNESMSAMTSKELTLLMTALNQDPFDINNQANIDYIMEDPSNRIPLIQRPEDFLIITWSQPELINIISFEDLNPLLLNSIKVIEKFSGNLEDHEIIQLPRDIFLNNPSLFRTIFQETWSIRLIEHLCQWSEEAIAYCYNELKELKNTWILLIDERLGFDTPKWSIDLMSQEFPTSIISYDKVNGGDLFDHKYLELLDNSEGWGLEFAVWEWFWSWEFPMLPMPIMVEPHVLVSQYLDKMDNWASINVFGISKTKQELVGIMIDKWYFESLHFLHKDPNINTDIWIKAIQTSPENIRFLDGDFLANEWLGALLNAISKNPEENIKYLNYIKLPYQDTTKCLDIWVKILSSNVADYIALDSRLFTQISIILDNISSQTLWSIIRDSSPEWEARKKVFFEMINVAEIRQDTIVIKEKALKVKEEWWILQWSTDCITSSRISTEGREKLISEINSAHSINQEIMNVLLEEFKWKPEELKAFTESLLQSLERDLEVRMQWIENTIFKLVDIPDDIQELFKIDSEKQEAQINREKMQAKILKFYEEIWQNIPAEKKTEAFILFATQWIDKDSKAYKLIVDWVETNEGLLTTQHWLKNIDELMQRGFQWTLDDFNKDILDKIYSWEVIYIPTKEFSSESKSQQSNNNEPWPSSVQEVYEIWWTNENPTILSGKNTISITPEEAEMVRINPEAAENLINMYEFFKELNLIGVWDYREELVNAVWEVHINLEDDSLKESELLEFGKKILHLINNIQEDEQEESWKAQNIVNPNITSIDSLNKELSKFSKSRDFWWGNASFNTYGDGRFKAWMLSHGIIWWITFHTSKVREMIK